MSQSHIDSVSQFMQNQFPGGEDVLEELTRESLVNPHALEELIQRAVLADRLQRDELADIHLTQTTKFRVISPKTRYIETLEGYENGVLITFDRETNALVVGPII